MYIDSLLDVYPLTLQYVLENGQVHINWLCGDEYWFTIRYISINLTICIRKWTSVY